MTLSNSSSISVYFTVALFLIIFVPVLLCAADSEKKASGNPIVTMKTTMGDIEIELYADKAPESVKNFLSYVNSNYYSGLIFHRVIPNFMVQGGGFTAKMLKKETKEPIKNEAGNGLTNERGTLAMARTSEVNSATAQFFINLVNNDFLNHKDESSQGFGYAVFGKVIKGLDVVDKIAEVKTTNMGPYQNVPVEPVTIISVTQLKK
ncbi:MAG: peptidylprolyl isomerase [Candidatus Schekmanbacteria bacterium]|nr:peptidylprolyl isomerase [Candidatus Schekmanbacteria bacterium]